MIARLVAATVGVALFAYAAAVVIAVLLVALGVWGILRGARDLRRRYRTEIDERCQQRAELLARADIQHRWYLAGDPRGVYGRYTPAVGTR